MSQQQSTTANSIGKPVDRVDGRLKVTGGARYATEYPVERVVHAVFATSRIARGRITRINTRSALDAPGVLAVLTHENIPKLARRPEAFAEGGLQAGMSFSPLQDPEIFYAGQHIALVVAETLEQAEHAATLVDVSYREEKPLVHATDSGARLYEPKAIMGGGVPGRTRRGNPQQAIAASPVRVEATYTNSTCHHNPMEPSATTAVWNGDVLTLYESTQGVTNTQAVVARQLGIPRDKVRVITNFLGGGFGCKGTNWPHTSLCAIAARVVNRPVKLALSRQQTFTSHGHREEQTQKLTLSATRDGRLTAIVHEKTSPTSFFDDWAEPNGNVINMMYACPNFETSYKLARVNLMTSTFMRAPGEAPGMFALESGMDELAYKLGLDPIEIRLRNHADVDPSNEQQWSSKSLKQCYARGAELFGWSKRNSQPRSMRDGHILIGYGMASATYPIYPAKSSARAQVFANGSARVQSGTTDMGVGTYTIMTQVAADNLGLPVNQVRFELGDTTLPTAPTSGGSVGAGVVSSAVYMACQALRAKATSMAIQDKSSPLFGAKPEQLAIENGRLFLRDNRDQGETYAQLLTRNGLADIAATGDAQYGEGYSSEVGHPESREPQQGGGGDRTKYSMHAFGAHFCEVRVDETLGQVRVSRWVGVHAGGRILNAKTARSQIIGGAVYGIGYALHEATHMDARYGRYVNSNLGEYHVPVNADIPDMTVEFVPEEDRHVNAMGVKGIGEIAMVGVAAAVANAIYHATGKRIRDLPITPDKLL